MLSSSAKFCACLLLVAASGCKQSDEAPAPIASATPTVPPAQIAPVTPPVAPTTATVVASADAAGTEALVDAAGNTDAGADAGTKAVPGAAGASIKRCCAALSAAVEKDALHANRYRAAAAVCNGLAKQVNTGAASAGAARTTLRAQLQGVPVPGGC